MTTRLACVVLAAGGSTRFGSPKQLLEYHGENLVTRAARVAVEAGVDKVIAVLGAFAPSVELFLAGLPDVEVVINTDWQTGQASSLIAGLTASRKAGSDATLVMLADQPLVDAGSIRKLIEELSRGHRVVAACYDDTVGVPAIFGSEYYDKLLQLEGDQGAGKWIRSHLSIVTAVPMREASMDVDYPDDMRKLTRSSTAE